MPSHIETLLTTVGVPAEDILAVSGLKDTDTFDPAPIVAKVKSGFQTQFQNDPAFFNDMTIEKLPAETKKKIEAAQFGRASNIVRDKALKGLGFTEADIADMTDEQKQKLELFIPALAEKYTKTKAGDKETQAQLIAERKKREELEAKYGPDYEKTIEQKHETAANQKITAALLNASLIGELSAIPGLKIPAGDIAPSALNALLSKYGYERVGDFGIELRQKANPQMKVLKNNSSQELTLKEALAEIATERGWVEAPTDDGKTGGGKTKIIPTKDGTLKMMPPHLQDSIGKKIAAEK